MSVETAQNARKPGRSSFLTDQRSRSIFFQALILGIVGVFFVFIISNTVHNLEKRGIATGFDFLNTVAGYDISISPFIDYVATDTHGTVFLVGIQNTLMVAVLGIIAATVLGIVLGVLRLSNNWLISRVVYVYIELTRNIPLLLQILFWYGIFLGLPKVKKSIVLFDTFYLNQRGFFAPDPLFQDGFSLVIWAFVIGLVGSIFYSRMAKKKQALTGKISPVFTVNASLILGLPLLAFVVTGFPVEFDYPILKGFNFKGGMVIKPEFTALWFALSVYTAGFIAEVVRAGIQSVSHGQTEAALSLGLKQSWTMKMIVLPQALRVIVPPLTSQFLNLTKNSSLAVAIGYPDLVQSFGGVTLNQTGQAIEVIAMTMLVYLTISLLISSFMNWYNSRIKLSER